MKEVKYESPKTEVVDLELQGTITTSFEGEDSVVENE